MHQRGRLVLALVLAFAWTSFATNVWTGTWKLRALPDSKVAARTIRIEESGAESFREMWDEVSPTGTKSHTEIFRVCDGKEHSFPREAAGIVHICESTGAWTRKLTGKKDGKVTEEVIHSLSADGKVLTVTNQQTGVVTIYDKQ